MGDSLSHHSGLTETLIHDKKFDLKVLDAAKQDGWTCEREGLRVARPPHIRVSRLAVHFM